MVSSCRDEHTGSERLSDIPHHRANKLTEPDWILVLSDPIDTVMPIGAGSGIGSGSVRVCQETDDTLKLVWRALWKDYLPYQRWAEHRTLKGQCSSLGLVTVGLCHYL